MVDGGDRGQLLVVDLHHLAGVLGLGATRRHHDGDGVAHETDLLARERGVDRGMLGLGALELERERVLGHLGGGQDERHPGRCPRRGRVDACDARA